MSEVAQAHVRMFELFSGEQADPLWLESVQGQEEAVVLMNAFAEKTPGKYFVFDLQKHCVIASVDTSKLAP